MSDYFIFFISLKLAKDLTRLNFPLEIILYMEDRMKCSVPKCDFREKYK